MGVSIHYRGRLNDTALLSTLCDELGDIADSMGWPSVSLDDDWSTPPDAVPKSCGEVQGYLGLRGVQITPHPDSEPLVLFFDANGYIRSPITMLMILDGTLQPETAWVAMKTQFAGPDIHVLVVGLLKYLKKRYIANLEVSDESEYWESGDRRKLEKDMTLLNGKLQYLSGAISSGRMGHLSGFTADEIADRIERFILTDGDRGAEQSP